MNGWIKNSGSSSPLGNSSQLVGVITRIADVTKWFLFKCP